MNTIMLPFQLQQCGVLPRDWNREKELECACRGAFGLEFRLV